MNTEVYALYLPQFHRTKENDEWWGEGFTEWNSVKSAKKLHAKSRQPRVPLEGYYDLSDVESIRRQAELACHYSVDGFAIYHYYTNGRLLLNKPSEILLSHKEIKIKFFFSWANHDWRRTWYGYNFEILSKQEYGDENGIKKHFEYLLPFFCDSRYKKIDNKPVFAIYKSSYIPNLNQYVEIWNELAKEHGFCGIYFIQTIDETGHEDIGKLFDAAFDFQPNSALSSKQLNNQKLINKFRAFLLKKMGVKLVSNIYNYDKVASIIENEQHSNSKHYYGLFPGWDNTPRHKLRGTFFKKETVDRFKKLFEIQYAKANKAGHELLIINAWNEWSEGAYMEPDTDIHYGRLEAIQKVKQAYESN